MATALGRASAELLVERHLQDQGDYPRSLLLTAWGTANMRTGGDDIAHPERIARQLAVLDERPEVHIVGTNCVQIDGEGRLLFTDFVNHVIYRRAPDGTTNVDDLRARLTGGDALPPKELSLRS